MLQLKQITKNYATQNILNISAVELEKAVYWIKGANGSGKTTLLKVIAGLLPFEGDILFNEISCKNNPLAYRRNISWAEAEPLYPEFITGTDMIALHREIRKTETDEVDTLLDLFGMRGYINDAIGTYSAGMTKKLSLLLAFMNSLPLIILDEPLITLDEDAFKVVCDLILKRHTIEGTTFLLSSHHSLDPQLLLSGKEMTVYNQMLHRAI